MNGFEHKKLKALIKEKGYTIKTFAKEFGMTERNMQKKLDGEIETSRSQIIKMCNLLDIPANKMVHYFFPIKYKDGRRNY